MKKSSTGSSKKAKGKVRKGDLKHISGGNRIRDGLSDKEINALLIERELLERERKADGQ